jgi:peptide/nickel transport system substrate-binding protein
MIRRSTWLVRVVVMALLLGPACSGTAEPVFETAATTIAPSSETTGPATDTSPTTAAAAPATTLAPGTIRPYGGEIVIGDDEEPTTLNVFAPGGNNAIASLIGNGYLVGAYRIDGDTLDLVPDVLTELPTVANGGIAVNADGTETIRYTIRDEAVWADGVPISGHDFAFTYGAIMDSANAFDQAGYADILPGSVVAGDKNFEFTLAAPSLQAEFLFGTILPKHDVEGTDLATAWNDRMWVSGGPFVFDQWRRGEFIRLVRNPNYWRTDPDSGQRLPYLDSVVIRFIPDTLALLTAFEERVLDVIEPPPAADVLDGFRSLESVGAVLTVESGPHWEHIGFQFGAQGLFRNLTSYNEYLEYRQAVAHAIDRTAIAEAVLGPGAPSLDSYMNAYSRTLSLGAWGQYDHDPARARELIGALCDRSDVDCVARPPTAVFTTNANNEARVAVGELLVPMFEEVGIDLRIELEEPLDFFSAEVFDAGRWDLAAWAWTGGPGLATLVDFVRTFDPALVPPFGLNVYRWGSGAVSGAAPPELDQGPSRVQDEFTMRMAEITGALDGTVDTAVLAPLLGEAEQLLADQVVFIPLFANPEATVVWGDEVGGVRHNPSQGGLTWNIAEWYRADL